MSFEEPNNPRSSEIVNNQIQLTELATYEERTPVQLIDFWELTEILSLNIATNFDVFFTQINHTAI